MPCHDKTIHVTSRLLTLHHSTPLDASSCHTMPRLFMPHCATRTTPHASRCYTTSRHTMPRHFTPPHHATLRTFTSSYVPTRHVTLRRVTTSGVTPPFCASRHITSRLTSPRQVAMTIKITKNMRM